MATSATRAATRETHKGLIALTASALNDVTNASTGGASATSACKGKLRCLIITRRCAKAKVLASERARRDDESGKTHGYRHLSLILFNLQKTPWSARMAHVVRKDWLHCFVIDANARRAIDKIANTTTGRKAAWCKRLFGPILLRSVTFPASARAHMLLAADSGNQVMGKGGSTSSKQVVHKLFGALSYFYPDCGHERSKAAAPQRSREAVKKDEGIFELLHTLHLVRAQTFQERSTTHDLQVTFRRKLFHTVDFAELIAEKMLHWWRNKEIHLESYHEASWMQYTSAIARKYRELHQLAMYVLQSSIAAASEVVCERRWARDAAAHATW